MMAAREKTQVPLLWLGKVPFREAREIQFQKQKEVEKEASSETLICCEHLPVLTFGKRVLEEDMKEQEKECRVMGIDAVRTNRGGLTTYHAPGQLVLYPVISLRTRGLGVKRFVELGLSALSDIAKHYGVPAEVKLEPAGVWASQKKIASVGLQIKKGITNHGFSLNVNCPLEPFSHFACCGLEGVGASSLAEECLGEKSVQKWDIKEIAGHFQVFFSRRLADIRGKHCVVPE